MSEKYVGESIPKLGFGMMRLPMREKEIDQDQVNRMADAFLAAGFTYVDTAFGYHDEQSEGVVKKTFVDRYPREKFLLATKLPLWKVKKAEDMETLFQTQLSRTGAGYFDFYLLHNINSEYLETVEAVDAFGFVRAKKAAGLVRHIGFSFHDTAEVLDGVLTRHPEVEFVQLQINYADWDDEKIQSGACYEVARKHGKSVIVMEPVKGGSLALLAPQARQVFEKADPDASVASWAMRFAANLEGVITVLSGMSNEEQMMDNIRTISNLKPLSPAEKQAIGQVQQILKTIPTTPCTDCKYCIESDGCPKAIPIPAIIATDNARRIFGKVDLGHYGFITRDKGKASDCIQCGHCESRCPQHLPIIELMEECGRVFG